MNIRQIFRGLPVSLLGVVFVLFLSSGAWAAEQTIDRSHPTQTANYYQRGEIAEAEGKWAEALDSYLRAFSQVGPSSELKERIRICLRNATGFTRHRDPVFQRYLLGLPVSDALNIYAEVLEKLTTRYVDHDRATVDRLFTLGLEELDRALADREFLAIHFRDAKSHRIPQFRQSVREVWTLRLPDSPREARHAARQLVMAAQSQAGVRNASAVVLELLCGACSGLDEYTAFLPTGWPPENDPVRSTDLAEYGILLTRQGPNVIVESVVAEGWVDLLSEMKKHDRIVRINGRTIGAGVTVAEALRQPSSFGHELEVESDNQATFTVRLPVPCPTVYGMEMLKEEIGYVRIASFRDTTVREFDDAVLSLQTRGMRALVVDLRGNPGGVLTSGVDLTSRMLPAGIVVTTRGQAPEFANRVFSSDSGMTAYDFPVVLLIDCRTMSAAEVVAIALKDHNRATLVGMPTFGKGAVQSPIPLESRPGADTKPAVLVLTVGAMYGPAGTAISGGVVPHVLESDRSRQLELAVTRAAALVPEMP